ncbi:MAG: penicillin-binding protein 1C [Nitrospirae bacterium]|nr:MAG: penicillin-binding protein 1C [Nitrospirota bacterium]
MTAFFPPEAAALPSYEQVKASYRKSEAVLLDRHGAVLHDLRIDPNGRRLEWVSLRDISPSVIRAVIQSEDRGYYAHAGVDWRAAASAVISRLFTKTKRGASTITMQLATILNSEYRPLRARKTLMQKWDQMTAARELERSWSKDAVLEAYLNLVTFRGELQGIAAGSRGLFGKAPHGLDADESAILASLIRSPNAPAGTVGRRACLLALSLQAGDRCRDIQDLSQKILTAPYAVRMDVALAPHAAAIIMKDADRSRSSTLDSSLQAFASGVLQQHLTTVRSQNVHDGAVVVADNRTGDILAYVGGIGSGSSARHVDGVRARRQAGSTLKPFLYALAFERMILTPASIINDSPLEVPTATGMYRPANYENDYKGFVSARTALASSLNVPAVRTLMLIGPDDFVQSLSRFGLSHLESGDYYGPSLALGSADISLWELVNAYRSLANAGILSEMRFTFNAPKSKRTRVLSESSAFLVSSILSDREARNLTFSLESPLATRFWTAVKTGTSKDMRDNWCIGYSSRYTVGVWVGNYRGNPMWHVSGITGAAPVWLEIMNYLHKNVRSMPPKPPSGVSMQEVQAGSGDGPARTEWFRTGTEPPVAGQAGIEAEKAGRRARIIYPSEGAIIALDPDIPVENQALFFEADTDGADRQWLLNNKDLGPSGGPVLWRPATGSYVLTLIDKEEQVIDSISFSVRGEAMGVQR